MVVCPRDPYPLPVALASPNGWSLSQNGAKLHNNIKNKKENTHYTTFSLFLKEKTKNICAKHLGANYRPDKGIPSTAEGYRKHS